jgi:hypothetical protein
MDGSIHSSTNSQGESDNLAAPITYCGNPVQGALYASAIIFAKSAKIISGMLNIARGYFVGADDEASTEKSCLWHSAQIQDDFQKLSDVIAFQKRSADFRGQGFD